MTEDKKNKIRELRMRGYGYSTIADFISEKRDDVRNYCRKVGLDGRMAITYPQHNKQSEEDVKEKVNKYTKGRYEYVDGYTNADNKINVRCSVCGNVFSRYYRDVLFGEYNCPKCKEKQKECIQWVEEITALKRKIAVYEDKLNVLIQKAVERENSKRTCPVCGVKFTRGRRIRYCSNSCANKNRNRIKDKRIKKECVVDKDISLQSLYKRDNGVCYICGRLCDWNDYIVRDGTVICGDWYPSIEHIMPISKGGLHSWDNVRLAHRICNTRKGNHMPPGWHTGYITRATGCG